MIHLYAFADELRGLPELAGVDGAPLQARIVEGLAAVSSDRSGFGDAGPAEAQAIAHGRVVEALTGFAAAVLPVRFGEKFADEDALARAVAARADELRRRLERVRGCVELGVRVVSERRRTPHLRAPSGAAYMRAKRELLAADDETFGALHSELRRLARESTTPRGNLQSAAYLVRRAELTAVRERVERFASTHPDVTVLCTGPWAPYSFVLEQRS